MKELNLFVDGSYSTSTPTQTAGAILIYQEQDNGKDEIISIRRIVSQNPTYVKTKNVGGELLAALLGLMECCEKSKNIETRINLFYDYKGIESFITGEFKAKTACAKFYQSSIYSVLDRNKNVTLTFRKVTSHSDNKYNDIVDLIAKGSPPSWCVKYINKTLKF